MNNKKKITQIMSVLIAAAMITPDAITSEGVGEAISEIKSAVSETKETADTAPEKEENILVITQDTALFEDTVVDKLYVSDGTFNLNGFKLTVNGDAVVASSLNVNGGTLDVGGDLRIQREYTDEEGVKYYTAYNARFIMQNEESYVKVNGNFVFNSGHEHSGFLSAGTLEIKGNLEHYVYDNKAFSPVGDFKILFSGDSEHTVMLGYILDSLNNFEIEKSSKGAVLFTATAGWSTFTGNKALIKFSNGGRLGWKLTKDETIEGDLMLAGDTLDLNGHKLTVKGNFRQPDGTVILNGGTLTVTGDYSIAGEEGGASSGKLIMQNSADVLDVRGNFTTNSSYGHNGILTEGKIKIAGDLTQLNRSNFCMTDNISLELCGSKKQTVSYASPENSQITELIITNTSEEGVELRTDVAVTGKLHDTKASVTGRVIMKENAVFAENAWPGSVITNTDYVLADDTEIKGNLYVSDGTFNLNGFKLTVNGDAVVASSLNVNGGTLDVGGDLRIQREYTDEEGVKYYTAYSARFIMQKEGSYVKVNGNFVIENGIEHNDLLSTGTLEIKGDLKHYVYDKKVFSPVGDFKILFSGDSEHNVMLGYIYDSLHNFEIEKSSKGAVLFTATSKWDEFTGNKALLKFSNGGRLGWKLTKDETIEGDLMLAGDTLDLNGHKLTVKGNFRQPDGTVILNGGILTVTGDYSIAGEDGGASSGRLIMRNSDDVLDVRGNFTTNSSYGHNGILTEGKIKIAGDLTQLNGSNFCMTENSELILCGTEKQKILYSDNYNSSVSVLRIINTSEEGVEFASNISVTKTLYDTESVISGNGTVCIRNNTVLADNSWKGNITVDGGYILSEDTDIKGNVYISSRGSLDLADKKLKVGGKMISVSTLNMNNGELEVGKDLRFQAEGIAADGTYYYTYAGNSALVMQNEDAYIKVNGDFAISSGKDHVSLLTAGLMEIKGDFYQNYERCFNPSDDHKVILSGDKKQKVSFETDGCAFNILEITQNLDNYVFNKEKPWAELIEAHTDTKAPSVPANIKCSKNNSVSLTLAWDASSDDSSVRGYEVYRDGVRIADTPEPSFTDVMLEPETKYSYQITAYDNSRNTSEKSKAFEVTTNKDTEKPSAPVSPHIVSQTADSVKLAWSEASDNHRITGYIILRDGKKIGEVNGLSFEDTGIAHGIYSYTVEAVDASKNESLPSEEVSVDLLPPEPPVDLSAEYTDNSIVLSWGVKNEEADVIFTVYRKSDSDADYELIARSENLSIEDKNIKPGIKYDYRITAADKLGNVSDYSKVFAASIEKDIVKPVITGCTLSSGTVINNTSSVSLNYSDNFDMASVKVEYKAEGSEKWNVMISEKVAADSKSGSYKIDTARLETGKYSFRFTVADMYGNSSEPVENEYEYYKISAAAPVLSVKTENNTAQLSWNKSADETVKGYRIFRKTAGDENFTMIAELEQNVFTDDSELTEGVMYSYYAELYDVYGNVLASNTADIVIASEQDFSERPYGFILRDGYAVITSCDRSAEKIVIPAEINEIPVTEIGDMAFAGSKAKSVELPDSVKKIGYSAFRDCAALTEVKIPENIDQINDESFINCKSLKTLSVYGANINGTKVFGVSIDKNGEEVTDTAFKLKACLGSSGQKYAVSNEMFYIPSDCEYTAGDEYVTLVSYKGSAVSVDIPEMIEKKPVKVISGSAFKANETITEAFIPETVEEIGSYAFMNCLNLSNIQFSEGTLKKCGSDFLYNTAYEKADNSEFMMIGGNYLYRYKGNSINVVIPQKVEIIGCDAFADCDFIRSISIGDSVRTILNGAFFGCEGLTEVVLPETVETVGDYAFSCCSSLKSVSVSKNTAVGKDVFFDCPEYTESAEAVPEK